MKVLEGQLNKHLQARKRVNATDLWRAFHKTLEKVEDPAVRASLLELALVLQLALEAAPLPEGHNPPDVLL